jgi:hypothetical protein
LLREKLSLPVGAASAATESSDADVVAAKAAPTKGNVDFIPHLDTT